MLRFDFRQRDTLLFFCRRAMLDDVTPAMPTTCRYSRVYATMPDAFFSLRCRLPYFSDACRHAAAMRDA